MDVHKSSKNNHAKFHLDPIWRDRALVCLRWSPQQKETDVCKIWVAADPIGGILYLAHGVYYIVLTSACVATTCKREIMWCALYSTVSHNFNYTNNDCTYRAWTVQVYAKNRQRHPKPGFGLCKQSSSVRRQKTKRLARWMWGKRLIQQQDTKIKMTGWRHSLILQLQAANDGNAGHINVFATGDCVQTPSIRSMIVVSRPTWYCSNSGAHQSKSTRKFSKADKPAR